MSKASHKILVVDDEPMILDLLRYTLQKENYEVYTAFDGLEALTLIKKEKFSLVILDNMMPYMSGMQLAEVLKVEKIETKVVFLTASADEQTEVDAFGLGAVDFIHKPIRPLALISRLNSILEKTNKIELYVQDLKINPHTYTVEKSTGETYKLPKKEFELLIYLAEKPNQVISRDELLKTIWGTVVAERTVDVHIRKIREKIGEKYIETLKGVGYLFKN